MKRPLLLVAGICWIVFAFGFVFLLVRYVAEGAGLQFWIPIVSSGSVLVGWVHVVGLCTAAVLCFVIGSGLCARGLFRGKEPGREELQRPE